MVGNGWRKKSSRLELGQEVQPTAMSPDQPTGQFDQGVTFARELGLDRMLTQWQLEMLEAIEKDTAISVAESIRLAVDGYIARFAIPAIETASPSSPPRSETCRERDNRLRPRF